MFEPSEVFLKAEQDLRANGWVKRDWRRKGKGKCLVRAVLDAAGIRRRRLPLALCRPLDAELSKKRSYRRIKQAVSEAHPHWGARAVTQQSIVKWNDLRRTRKIQVINLLNRVVSQLEVAALFESLDAEQEHTAEHQLVNG